MAIMPVWVCIAPILLLAVATLASAAPAPACVLTPATNVCINVTTGDLWQLNGKSMLPGSGTALQDCAPAPGAAPVVTRLAGGGRRVARALACAPNAYHDAPNNASVALVDEFTPAADGSIAWNVSVRGAPAGPRWSTAVATALGFADWRDVAGPAHSRAWVGGPHVAALPNATFDPLAPFAVDGPAARYGDFVYGTPRSNIYPQPGVDDGRATHIPVLARVDGHGATAVVQALDYVPIVSKTNVGVAAASSTTGDGARVWLNYTRLYERLGGGTPALAFAQHVLGIPHGDWRPAVAWLNARFPAWFEPRADAHALDWEGPASYADLRGASDFPAADAPHYAAMGYKLNWDSTARFPWHGEWVPTDADGFNGLNWTSCFAHDPPDAHVDEGCGTFSYAELSGWYAHQRALGFRTCNYANFFEFGWDAAEAWNPSGAGAPIPVDCSAAATGGTSQAHRERALLCHTQRLLAPGSPPGPAGGYAPALLVDVANASKLVCGGLDGACVMDPHPTLPYLAHVLDMARTGLARTNSSGVCIDRQDWIAQVNPRADDGRTWYPLGARSRAAPAFGPVRAMIFSWHEAMAALAGVMHAPANATFGGKAIIINDHVNRVGMMRHVDGIYAEMGDISPPGFTHVVGSALACMHKPVVSWIHDDPRWGNFSTLEQALQGYLYLGVYPTVPVKNNDHSIGGACAPHCSYDALFQDYGPLFGALRGKRWVLAPRAAAMADTDASGLGRVNVFETRHNGGFVAVVTQVPDGQDAADVALMLPGCVTPITGTALHPGGGRAAVAFTAHGLAPVTATVPVVRRCAVVVIECDARVPRHA